MTGSIGLYVTSSVNAIYVVNSIMKHWIFYFVSDIKILFSSSGYVEQCMFNRQDLERNGRGQF